MPVNFHIYVYVYSSMSNTLVIRTSRKDQIFSVSYRLRATEPSE